MQTSSTMQFRNLVMLTQTMTPGVRRVEPVMKRFAMPEPKREARAVVPTAGPEHEDGERWDGLA